MPEEIINWSARANHSATKLAKWLGENYGPDYAERYMNAMLRVIENVAKHPTKGLVVRTGEVRRWKLEQNCLRDLKILRIQPEIWTTLTESNGFSTH